MLAILRLSANPTHVHVNQQMFSLTPSINPSYGGRTKLPISFLTPTFAAGQSSLSPLTVFDTAPLNPTIATGRSSPSPLTLPFAAGRSSPSLLTPTFAAGRSSLSPLTVSDTAQRSSSLNPNYCGWTKLTLSLKVYENVNFLAPIFNFVLFHC
jgi:hypothetical protein